MYWNIWCLGARNTVKLFRALSVPRVHSNSKVTTKQLMHVMLMTHVCLSHLRHKSNTWGHRQSRNLKEIEGQSRISVWRALSGPRYSLHDVESIPEQLNFWNAAISRPEILLAGISQTLPVPKRILSFWPKRRSDLMASCIVALRSVSNPIGMAMVRTA